MIILQLSPLLLKTSLSLYQLSVSLGYYKAQRNFSLYGWSCVFIVSLTWLGRVCLWRESASNSLLTAIEAAMSSKLSNSCYGMRNDGASMYQYNLIWFCIMTLGNICNYLLRLREVHHSRDCSSDPWEWKLIPCLCSNQNVFSPSAVTVSKRFCMEAIELKSRRTAWLINECIRQTMPDFSRTRYSISTIPQMALWIWADIDVIANQFRVNF